MWPAICGVLYVTLRVRQFAWSRVIGIASPLCCIVQTSFYGALSSFLATSDGSAFRGDIVWRNIANPAQGLEVARMRFGWVQIAPRATMDMVHAMQETRKIIADAPRPLSSNTFAYAPIFLSIEQFAAIKQEAYLNITVGVVMIALVTLLLLPSLAVGFLTFLAIASTIVELLGILSLLGYNIDSVVTVFVVISMGLAVDYSVHMAHGFMACDAADSRVRLQDTMVVRATSGAAQSTLTLQFALCTLSHNE